MIQNWSHAHELSGCLIGLVKFLDIRFRVAERPLNPLALDYQIKEHIEQNEQRIKEE